MGAETQSSVSSRPRRALHQQYLPWPRNGREHWQRPDVGLYPGEPETCRRNVRLFLRNFIYLALLLAVFKVYRIEERAFQGRAFQTLVTLALLALPLHYLAPFRWKKPLFVAVSMAGLFWIFGAMVAAAVLIASAILIGICFLPIPWIRARGGRRHRRRRPGLCAGPCPARSCPTTSYRLSHQCLCSE